MIGQGFSFNGLGAYVEINDAQAFNFAPTGPMSLLLWGYRTGSSGVMHLVGKREGCGGGGDVTHFQMAFDGGGLVFGGDHGSVRAGTQMPMNVWVHLAGTFDGANFRFYYNGRLVGTGSGTLGPPTATPLRIGKSGDCAPFAGLLDEISIYDRALSASEIQASYAAGTNGMCPPTPLMFGRSSPYTKTNGFVLNASLRSGQSYRIQANTNVAGTNWVLLTNFTADTAPVSRFTDTTATNFPQRFYRLVSP
jgi:hypothetical protein